MLINLEVLGRHREDDRARFLTGQCALGGADLRQLGREGFRSGWECAQPPRKAAKAQGDITPAIQGCDRRYRESLHHRG
eukprot:3763778-Prymnesium_polylepis.1